jgi:hypothetical protein
MIWPMLRGDIGITRYNSELELGVLSYVSTTRGMVNVDALLHDDIPFYSPRFDIWRLLSKDMPDYPQYAQPVKWTGADTVTDAEEQDVYTKSLPAGDEFDTVLSRVAALTHEDDDEDRPTNYALRSTLTILFATRELLEIPFPRASTAVTQDRGIQVYWKRGGRFVELSIPPKDGGTEFIFHDDGSEYRAEQEVNGRVLAHWLRWLTAL